MEKPQATHEEPEESGQANPGALSFVKLLGIEMVAYRILNPPPQSADFVPQIFMPDRAVPVKYYPPDMLKAMPDRHKQRRLSESGLSFFDTPEHAEQAARQRDRNKAKKGLSTDERKQMRESFGRQVSKLQLKKCDGLSTLPDEKGHIDFLPYEGVRFEERVDLRFEYTITYEDDE
jgi:hypothetical protein